MRERSLWSPMMGMCVWTCSHFFPHHMLTRAALYWLIVTGEIVPSAPFCILIDYSHFLTLTPPLSVLVTPHSTPPCLGCLSFLLLLSQFRINIWPLLASHWYLLASLIVHLRYSLSKLFWMLPCPTIGSTHVGLKTHIGCILCALVINQFAKISRKWINNFDNVSIIIHQAEMPSISLFQVLKCEDMMLFWPLISL